MNAKDERILKFFNQGCTIERIAAKLGDPNNLERVKEGLKRCNVYRDNENPLYEVIIMVADGPDDVTLEPYAEFKEYLDCIKCATDLHDKGYYVKIFDPYVGETYQFPKDF